jgi:hypothetical protein
MFLFVLLTAIGLSWVAARMQQARRQRATVDALAKRGWVVYYDWAVSPDDSDLLPRTEDKIWVLTANVEDPQPPGPSWLRNLLGVDFFAHAVRAYQTSPNVWDADLRHIERLTRLQRLDLRGRTVTDAGLKHLEGLKDLKSLELTGTATTDAGLEHINQGIAEPQIARPHGCRNH